MNERIWHGVAYYPEQWGLENLDSDVSVMHELGINEVRMMEFAWSTIEPREHEYDFSLFDECIERLYREGIYTVLCTPTATPPRWFSLQHPESLVVNRAGEVMHHGSREHVCWNNDLFIQKTKEIVAVIADRYARNPAVIGFQIHNEPGMPVSACYCASCRKKWTEFLRARYKNIETLNRAWNNKIWSFEYPDFGSIEPPVSTPYLHGASHRSLYREFAAKSLAKYIAMQADVVRKRTDLPLTTNVFRSFEIDFQAMFSALDYAGIDEYSTFANYPESTLNFDLARALSKTSFAVLETPPTSAGNIVEVLPYHHPHYIKALAVSSLFAGGNMFNYWQYRQSRGGAEMPHGHVIDACGNPTPAFRNLKEVSAAMRSLSPFLLCTKPTKAKAALAYDDRSRLFSMTENLKEFCYDADFLQSYRVLSEAGVYRDVVCGNSDLTGYRVIYVPYAIAIGEDFCGRLYRAAEEGATVIMGAYTGIRTEEHTLSCDCVLGNAERRLGKKCLYFTQLRGEGCVCFEGVKSELRGHAAVFPNDADCQGRIQGGVCDGLSAISVYPYGKGKIVFAVFKPSYEMEKALIDRALCENGVYRVKIGRGVAFYERTDGNKNYRCFVNLSDGASVADSIVLEAGEYLITDETGAEIHL